MDKTSSQEVIGTWRQELLGYLKEIHQFQDEEDLSYILKKLAAYSARASYMRSVAVRSNNREVTNFRIDELDPFLKENEFQFRVWSRVAAVNAAEWEQTRGA